MTEIKNLKKENLDIFICRDKFEVGVRSARFVAKKLREAINKNKTANLLLATGASQFSFIEQLQLEDIDWREIVVFHLDEYKGISENHPASLRKYLKERIFNRVTPMQVHYMNGDAPDVEAEALRYEDLLKENTMDVACVGIGENGHLAFNDPPVADFNDSRLVKIVKIDDASRRQQYGEGWFTAIEDVPEYALTLTIPAIMKSRIISCAVPEKRKAQAVFDTLHSEISTACPATILRKHPNARLFLDLDSASKLNII